MRLTELVLWLSYLDLLLPLLLVVLGALFFCAGTVGLLRFPDVFTRLHALTKADNLGLGLICLGLAWQAKTLTIALKLAVIWLLVLLGSAVSCPLIARYALRNRTTQ